MNNEWKAIQDARGVCVQECDVLDQNDSVGIGTQADAALIDVRRDYRWTSACQRAFLEALACTGSVMRAAKEVEKSPRAAYDLRFRREGTAFRLGWDAAILVARATFHDMLMDRAINGYEEISTKQDDGVIIRGKFDNKLGMALLNRLDKVAETQAVAYSHVAMVQTIVQDFEAFLDLIEKGGKGSEAALFVAVRDGSADEDIDCVDERDFERELDRISADQARLPDLLDEEPEVAAQRLSIWYDDAEEGWKTNYPKTEADCEYVDETGIFGDVDYERTLSDAEETAHLAAMARERAPWIAAATAARDQWLGVKMVA